VEDRAFRDRQYLQRILAAESDLIDEYVRGGLSDSQRRLFDSRFLASAERRQKVEFARALSSVISEGRAAAEKESRPAITRASPWSRLQAFLRGLRPVTGFALAAASLLLVIGISWAVRETMRLRTQVAELQAERQTSERDRQSLERQLATERARREDLSSRLQTEQQERERNEESARQLERERQEIAAKPPEPSQPSKPPVVTLALLAGISRGAGGTRPKLVLPLSARLVRLQIGIEPGDDYKSFRAELNTQAGQRVLTGDNLSARATGRGRIIILNVPASILETGQYELSLRGRDAAGKTDDIGYYYFEVLRK
jgi:hypothetical protein